MTKKNIFIRIPQIFFLTIATASIVKYLYYINAILRFPFDWEPTDGDHLNFAHRLAEGLPIYLSMRSGQVLSIYNPLYHSIVAILGGEHASLIFARTVSFIFWAICPLMVFIYFSKKWGYLYSLIAALLIWLPSEPGLLIEIVQVSPNSTMAFLFLATLIYAEQCLEKKNIVWWNFFALGCLSSLCYLAKQQGLIAFASLMTFLLVKRVSIRMQLLSVIGFLFVFSLTTVYLEWVNSGEFLKSTIIDLHKIIIDDKSIAFNRLIAFIYNYNFYIIALVIASIMQTFLQLTGLTIWKISFILHIPFLLSILGNAGGGQNYFLTFWITSVLICIEMLKRLETSQVDVSIVIIVLFFYVFNYFDIRKKFFFLAILVFFAYSYSKKLHLLENVNAKYKKYKIFNSHIFSHFLIIIFFFNLSTLTIKNYKSISSFPLPTSILNKLMKDYNQRIRYFIRIKPNANVLTDRNIGALVMNGANVQNEGSTMFEYAWAYPKFFPRQRVLSSIRTKQFDMITTGITPYPEEVQKTIEKNYKISFTNKVNMIFGKIGLVKVYIPK